MGRPADAARPAVAAVLQARGLTKRYGGLLALDRVSFDLHPGEIVGYLGPNGSGKSTTVNLVVGLLEPSAGDISLSGIRLSDDPIAYKRQLGYVPEEPSLYAHLTASDYLMLVGRLRRMPTAVLHKRVPELLRLLQLQDSRYRTMTAFSKGMRQRVLVASALLHNPQLLVLDEPFSGLDVNAGLLLRTLLRTLADEGRMILFSTHRFDMVEKLCSRVIVLSSGRVVVERRVADFARDGPDSLEDTFVRATMQPEFAPLAATNHRHHRRSMTCATRPEVVLTRHFFASLFDFGFLSDDGAEALKRAMLGSLAVALALGGLLVRVFMAKYSELSAGPYDAYQQAVLADHAFLMAVPMWFVAAAMGLAGESLFPNQLDFRILMAEPLSRPTIFGAKLAALLLFGGLFVAGTHVALTPLAALTMLGMLEAGRS